MHFRKRVSIEEQRAQKDDRFFRGRQVAFMIYEHFRATGACESVQICSEERLQNDDVQDFDTRWDQALTTASEIPAENVLEGLYKSKLQGSVQLQTVLAIYEQETVRNNGLPNCCSLKTSVRLHIDQMMRAKNLQGSERNSGKRSSNQESKTEKSQRG